MSQRSLFDPVTRVRRTDPETSHEAAEAIASKMRESQARVLHMARSLARPFTDSELVKVFEKTVPPMSPSGVRTRRSELVAFGLVRWTGKTVKIGKNSHRTWEAVR